jgi:predicted nuclease with TOPRIM domain
MPSYPLKWNEKNNNISTEKIDLLREENVQLKNKVSKLEKRVESLEKEFENLLINIE